MKRINFVFVVFLISFVIYGNNAFCQLGFRKGIKVGYNLATIHGDDLSGTKSRKAFAGGIGVELNFLRLLSIQVDVLYSPKGVSFQDNGETHLNYISVPMVIKRKFFPFGIRPYLFGGPEFNFLLSAKSGDTDIKDELTSEDLAFVFGGGVEFSFVGKSAYFEGRYSYGLNNINKDSAVSESKNRATQFFIGFLF